MKSKVFATRIVQFLFYLKPKFQASSSFLCLYRPVCVGPVRKPHCWFSHKVAHSIQSQLVHAGTNLGIKVIYLLTLLVYQNKKFVAQIQKHVKVGWS